MAGLVPAIHAVELPQWFVGAPTVPPAAGRCLIAGASRDHDVDGRDKPGHDGIGVIGSLSDAAVHYVAPRKSGGVASATSSASASSAAADRCPVDPSRRIESVRSAASFLPTAISTGTFASECSRTL